MKQWMQIAKISSEDRFSELNSVFGFDVFVCVCSCEDLDRRNENVCDVLLISQMKFIVFITIATTMKYEPYAQMIQLIPCNKHFEWLISILILIAFNFSPKRPPPQCAKSKYLP